MSFVAFGPFWCATEHMSRVNGVPAMAHSPNYQIPQQRQLDTLPQSSFDSRVPVKHLPVADVIITTRPSLDEPHHTTSHLSSASHISYPRAVHSLSESSYTPPASLANVPLASGKHPENVHAHRDSRNGRGVGYAVQNTMMRDQMPSHRSSYVQPTQHTIYTYTRDESLDERVESRDHALWILVSWSVRELWSSKSMS